MDQGSATFLLVQAYAQAEGGQFDEAGESLNAASKAADADSLEAEIESAEEAVSNGQPVRHRVPGGIPKR